MTQDTERTSATLPSLHDALGGGGIHYAVPGTTKEAVLKAALERLPLPEGTDRADLLKAMLAREELGSTAVGSGMAIPHVRNPTALHVTRPLVAMCFLEVPIDFGALDKKLVHTIFPLISPSVRSHIHMLSRLSFALREPTLQELLARRAPREEILAEIRRLEANLKPA